jgi:DNA-binding MarR family transcriptional regulator
MLAVTPAGMTQLLDRLEERRWITRLQHPNDRRATVLELTAEGRGLQRRAGVRSSRFLAEFAAEMSPQGLAALRTLSRELESLLARRALNPSNEE